MKKPTLEELQAVIKIKEILNDELQSKLKEKEEEIDKLKMSLHASERFRIEDASESIDDKNILHARLMDCKSQLTKSNEMNIEWTSEKLIGRVKDRHKELKGKGWDYRAFYNGWLEGRVDMLTEYQNSKK